MTRETVSIDGELHLSLETVARMYQVEVVWLREAHHRGLLRNCIVHESSVCVAATELDQVAVLVRLRTWIGPDLDAIALHLDGFLGR